jgi:hypothetical protein
MDISDIKIGMRVIVSKIIEEEEEYRYMIGKIGTVNNILPSNLIMLREITDCKFYAEELDPLAKKKMNEEDLIL